MPCCNGRGYGNETRVAGALSRALAAKSSAKIAHLMRRRHGGRRARVGGRLRVALAFALLASAINLARIGSTFLGLRRPSTAIEVEGNDPCAYWITQ
jgi:hypothetical protein